MSRYRCWSSLQGREVYHRPSGPGASKPPHMNAMMMSCKRTLVLRALYTVSWLTFGALAGYSCMSGKLVPDLRIGYCVALQYLLRVSRGGLMWAGLPCSSHVWISRGSSGRSISCPRGDTSKKITRVGNEQACRWALMVLVCIARGVWWCCEQPSSSLVPSLHYVKWILHLNRVNPSLLPGRLVRLLLALNGIGSRMSSSYNQATLDFSKSALPR